METLPRRLQTTWMTEMDLVAWIDNQDDHVNFEAIIIKNYKSDSLRP